MPPLAGSSMDTLILDAVAQGNPAFTRRPIDFPLVLTKIERGYVQRLRTSGREVDSEFV